MSKEYGCVGCGRILPHREYHERSTRARPVHPRCRRCRRDDRDRTLYPGICAACQRHRPIAGDGQCLRCLKDQGLRPCLRCGAVKALYLDFWKRQATCIACLKNDT